MTADDLVADYQAALQTQARANAAEAKADDHRKIVFSQQVLAAGDMAVTKAEHTARASKTYQEAQFILDEARLLSETAKGEAEYLRVRWETWRTKMSMAKTRIASNG